MKRIYKNIICIIFMILGIGIIVGTVILAKNNIHNDQQFSMPNNAPRESNNNEMPNENMPQQPSGDSEKKSNNKLSQTEPQVQEDNINQSSIQNENVPQMPEDNMNQNTVSMNEMKQQMKMPDDVHLIAKDSILKLTAWYIVSIVCGSLIFSLSLLYFILSMAGSKKVFITLDKGIIYSLSAIIVTSLISFGTIYYTNNNLLLPNSISTTNQREQNPPSTNFNEKNKTSKSESTSNN